MSTQLNQPIKSVAENHDHVVVVDSKGKQFQFDYVVCATHADTSLSFLDSPTDMQRRLLGSWRYSNNSAVLHTDTSIMPKNQSAWASWCVKEFRHLDSNVPVGVTYYMNRLQRLNEDRSYLVSLNLDDMIHDSHIKKIHYTHPVYSFESLASQSELPLLNREGRVKFCGAYFGFGFHVKMGFGQL